MLKYCELRGYRTPSSDSYRWARLCQVVGNVFGGTLSVGIAPYSDDRCMNPGDNEVYVVDGWEIIDRILPHEGFVEERGHDFDGMLHTLNESMPEAERLGALLDSAEIRSSELKFGDEVWVRGVDGKYSTYPVVAFDNDGTPLVARHDHDGDRSWNPNNRIWERFVRVAGRK